MQPQDRQDVPCRHHYFPALLSSGSVLYASTMIQSREVLDKLFGGAGRSLASLPRLPADLPAMRSRL